LVARPFHAHGAYYYDIGSGNGTFDPDANEARLSGTSPVLRDTTVLYRYGNATGTGMAGGVARVVRVAVESYGAAGCG